MPNENRLMGRHHFHVVIDAEIFKRYKAAVALAGGDMGSTLEKLMERFYIKRLGVK